jgi:methenyltetrahydrofolate cyclohydrolase
MVTFLKVLDPEDASTGGGSASAIAGAMAGALVAMTARLSVTGEAEQDFYGRIFTQAGQISQQLLEGSREDAQAFQSVRSAHRLPRQTDGEKTARQQAIQAAWRLAANVPLENARHCMQVIELGMALVSRVNLKVLSDLRCALLLARAGLLGCLENVQINLPAIQDAAVAAQLSAQANDLRQRLAGFDLSLGDE